MPVAWAAEIHSVGACSDWSHERTHFPPRRKSLGSPTCDRFSFQRPSTRRLRVSSRLSYDLCVERRVGDRMRKLPEVQQAKELMSEAIDWSVFKWMFEKPRVRETADRANDALDRLERTVKSRWNDEIRAEFKKLSRKSGGSTRGQQIAGQVQQMIKPEITLLLEKVREADEAARRARTDAEETFDEAERQLSTSLAREGCKKAIHSWELHEKAIRKAESVVSPADTGA